MERLSPIHNFPMVYIFYTTKPNALTVPSAEMTELSISVYINIVQFTAATSTEIPLLKLK